MLTPSATTSIGETRNPWPVAYRIKAGGFRINMDSSFGRAINWQAAGYRSDGLETLFRNLAVIGAVAAKLAGGRAAFGGSTDRGHREAARFPAPRPNRREKPLCCTSATLHREGKGLKRP
jgi:hypothetical protein